MQLIHGIKGAKRMNENMVNHPSHYNQNGKKECWDEMVDIFGIDAVIIFDCLNAYKYNYRAGNKNGNSIEQDMAKLKVYLEHADNLVNEHPTTLMFETLKILQSTKNILTKKTNESEE